VGCERSVITPLHKRTSRDYVARMADDKVGCMAKAKQYEYDYWDGDRRFGYGGYRYDGRWKIVAEALIAIYGLSAGARILDVGCGKGYVLYELKQLLPDALITGFDISRHGIGDAPEDIRESLFLYAAEDAYPWGDDYFDLVFSLNSLHNLRLFQLQRALAEIERVGKSKYIAVESYRNDQELFNLQCWALTAESFFDKAEWIWLYQHFGYTGDYEFIYFE
jgi:SAM-dependent methyltransferase